MSAEKPQASTGEPAEQERLLYCHCAYAKVVPAEVKTEVLLRLGASGRDFEAVPDLCEMSASKDEKLAELAACEDLTMVACFPRSVRWLFHAAGHQLNPEARVLNMREASAEELAQELGLGNAEGLPDAGEVEIDGSAPDEANLEDTGMESTNR